MQVKSCQGFCELLGDLRFLRSPSGSIIFSRCLPSAAWCDVKLSTLLNSLSVVTHIKHKRKILSENTNSWHFPHPLILTFNGANSDMFYSAFFCLILSNHFQALCRQIWVLFGLGRDEASKMGIASRKAELFLKEREWNKRVRKRWKRNDRKIRNILLSWVPEKVDPNM